MEYKTIISLLFTILFCEELIFLIYGSVKQRYQHWCNCHHKKDSFVKFYLKNFVSVHPQCPLCNRIFAHPKTLLCLLVNYSRPS